MSSTQQVRLGIIGLGNIAQQHIRHIVGGQVPACRVAAVCSRQPHPIATELAVPHFSDYRELVDSGLCDAVLIASPTFTHREAGDYALKAGLHVMMEKPIGLSVQEGEQLLATAGAGQVFAVMLNQRVDPLFLTMRGILQHGGLGSITRCQWNMTNWFRPDVYFQVSDWRATWRGEGGGLLLNQCIHNLDILQWLCGMPQRVTGFCGFGRYHAIEVEDEATAYLEFENGATGVFIGSTGEAPGSNRLEIVGDCGSLLFDGERLWHTRNSPATSVYSHETREMFGMPDCRTTDITPDRQVNQHARILANFVQGIRNGEALVAPAEDGLASLSLANAILLSAWTGEAVDLPIDAARYQAALDEKIRHSTLREKAAIEASVDMSRSYR